MQKMIDEQVDALKALWKNKRQLTFQILNLAMIVLSALMIWKSLMVVTKSESPVVVVLSGSMEPAFQRGDILFLSNYDDPIETGEIVVFKVRGRDIPIVHRVIKVRGVRVREYHLVNSIVRIITHFMITKKITKNSDTNARTQVHQEDEANATQLQILTKGDNNLVDDRGLYSDRQLWLDRDSIMGRARGSLPYVGMVTILLNDYPNLKYVSFFPFRLDTRITQTLFFFNTGTCSWV